MKKGIIMEMNDAFLTLLTPEGEFLRARRQNEQCMIGEEIHFFPIESHNTSNSISLKRRFKVKPAWAISVIAALLIFLGSFIPMYQDNKAYAYMSIDANPSVELGVNKKMQVVELTGYNKEGKKVVSSINDWKKKDISKITQAILSEIKKEGLINKTEPVIISMVHTTKPIEQVEDRLKENIEEIKTTVDNQQLKITVYTGTEKEREKAQALGITTGKYHEKKMNTSNNKEKAGKPNRNLIDKNENMTKNVPTEPVLPPGQLKKQSENSTIQNNASLNKPNTEMDGNGKPIPPGQLKKMDEDQTTKGNQQKKKQSFQYDNSNQSHNSNHYERSNQFEKLNQFGKSNRNAKSNKDEKQYK